MRPRPSGWVDGPRLADCKPIGIYPQERQMREYQVHPTPKGLWAIHLVVRGNPPCRIGDHYKSRKAAIVTARLLAGHSAVVTVAS